MNQPKDFVIDGDFARSAWLLKDSTIRIQKGNKFYFYAVRSFTEERIIIRFIKATRYSPAYPSLKSIQKELL